MSLLTSDNPITKERLFPPRSIVVVPFAPATIPRRVSSKWVVLCVCLVGSFVGGFGASLLLRPRTQPQEIKTQVTDFHIVVPDGQTIVTIFNPQTEPQEIGR